MGIYLEDPYYFAAGIATLVAAVQAALIALAVLFFVQRRAFDAVTSRIAPHARVAALIVAVVAVASSLIFSDWFDMAPCKLCWFQRIFIFPQVVVLTLATIRRHGPELFDYSIAFAALAIPISIFHYLLQMTDAPAVHAFAPCDVTGQAPSCSGFYVHMYGYVTIPLMALTTSVTILTLSIIGRRR